MNLTPDSLLDFYNSTIRNFIQGLTQGQKRALISSEPIIMILQFLVEIANYAIILLAKTGSIQSIADNQHKNRFASRF